MSDRFSIGTENDKLVVFDIPAYREDGWVEGYRLSLHSPNMNVVVNVDSPPYGTLLNEYFAELSYNWRGWEGEKLWSSIGGEYSIVSTMSKLGHAKIKIEVNVYGSPSDWMAVAEFDVEAGQLEGIYKNVKRFFNQ